MQNGSATLEDSLVISYNTKHILIIYSNHTIRYSHEWIKNLRPHKHMDVYSNFIDNCQNLEATQMSIDKRMSIYVVYMH